MEHKERSELKRARSVLLMSQEDVAKKLGLTRQYYALLESGQCNGTFDTWKKIQKLFNLKDKDVWLWIKNEEEN